MPTLTLNNLFELRNLTNKSSSPDNILRKVPSRPKNTDVRSREQLTLEEVEALMKAAGSIVRHPHRDRTLILTWFDIPNSRYTNLRVCGPKIGPAKGLILRFLGLCNDFKLKMQLI